MTVSHGWQWRFTLTGRTAGKVTLPQAVFTMIVDIGVYMGVIVAFYFGLAKFWLSPVQRGFYCNDPSIRQPFHPNTVPTTVLLLISLFAPLPLVFVAFWIRKNGLSRLPTLSVWKESTFVYLDYVVGFAITTISLEFLKCGVGRLRPNFVSMCQPDLSVCNRDGNAFIEQFECLNPLPKFGRNSRMSFPSGHAAAAVFVVLFLLNFLKRVLSNLECESDAASYVKSETKMTKRSAATATTSKKAQTADWLDTLLGLVLPDTFLASFDRKAFVASTFFYTVNGVYISFCVFCCVTRVTDCWHFTSDVIGGSLVAVLCFYLTMGKKYVGAAGSPKVSKID